MPHSTSATYVAKAWTSMDTRRHPVSTDVTAALRITGRWRSASSDGGGWIVVSIYLRAPVLACRQHRRYSDTSFTYRRNLRLSALAGRNVVGRQVLGSTPSLYVGPAEAYDAARIGGHRMRSVAPSASDVAVAKPLREMQHYQPTFYQAHN
ncbi:hypothetical protein OBBRIDRAFT_82261 [Obba rivulosa]|uniref:Uncharacterized protein n=1 Tax=Obba rivulosa TaxID=1052685 RepID=A0A8E2AXN3_9APHY|nr:hypothetical protein OBBRIDRAFT_82261 [Obba rivulosa]